MKAIKPILNYKESYNMHLINSFRFGIPVDNSMQLTFRTTVPNESVLIPATISAQYNCMIDFGDNTPAVQVLAHNPFWLHRAILQVHN